MADVKTMAQKSAEVNPTVQVARETSTPVVAGDFHEFSGSQAKMYTTYTNRMAKIEAALGNKSPLVS